MLANACIEGMASIPHTYGPIRECITGCSANGKGRRVHQHDVVRSIRQDDGLNAIVLGGLFHSRDVNYAVGIAANHQDRRRIRGWPR